MTEASASLSILIVEDVTAVREAIALILLDAGHRVERAENGAQAEVLLRDPQHRFDVVVTDLWMPEVDGLQLLARWRTARPETRFVVVSGGSRSMPLEVSTAAAEARGADAVVFKPFEPEELLAALTPSGQND